MIQVFLVLFLSFNSTSCKPVNQNDSLTDFCFPSAFLVYEKKNVFKGI